MLCVVRVDHQTDWLTSAATGSEEEYVLVYSNSPIIMTTVRTKESHGFAKNSDIGKINVKLKANPMTRKMKEVMTWLCGSDRELKMDVEESTF